MRLPSSPLPMQRIRFLEDVQDVPRYAVPQRPMVIAHCWACSKAFVGRDQVEALDKLEVHLELKHAGEAS